MNRDDEQVLVVPRNLIFKDGTWQGIKKDNLDYYLDLIKNNYQFKRRGDVENDPSFQQIVSYILFSFEKKFFLYKYIQGAGEKRLINSYQLGVGGHINLVDKGGDILEKATQREWEEEVCYKGNILSKKLVGILNDDSRPVEAVHLGLVWHFTGDNDNIFVRETDKLIGEMVNLEKIGKCVKDLLGWPSIIWRDYLSKIS
jgi:predicted NUDIX family phosphoesterase